MLLLYMLYVCIGCWLLAVGCCLLAVGCCLLAVACWLLPGDLVALSVDCCLLGGVSPRFPKKQLLGVALTHGVFDTLAGDIVALFVVC